ncbi:MAG TPA: alpha-galactosidase [Lacisediminihabitans sp.]|uniref:alpha-galactosidase n=1 Tax=Lacisediminihabitans sp. TaxID=2787631 RepID=UPI002ED7884E
MSAIEQAPEPGARADDDLFTLASGGVAVVVRCAPGTLPEVLHWGASGAFGSLSDIAFATSRGVGPSGLDETWPLTVLPAEADGWAGRPGMQGDVDGTILVADWQETSLEASATQLSFEAESRGLALGYHLRIDVAGLVTVRLTLANLSGCPVRLGALEATMPVGDRAREVLDFTGRWTRERTPQRAPLTMGSVVRESRRGRTGHDSPYLQVVGSPGFTDSSGELWAVHLAWSGDSVYRRDALPESRPLIGAGELLRPGEVVLGPGERYESPETYFAWSDAGLDGLSHRFHGSLRALGGEAASYRPVILNTWEAVYYDQDLDRLRRVAEASAQIGVELFVLDDGWFRGRRSDASGLGDWYVDREVWPLGLHPLVESVRRLGMQFGLWVEPEMVSPDSVLAREHPDWILGPGHRSPRTWRRQQVLDLTLPEVQDEVFRRLSSIVEEYGVEYVKWDQNRDVLEAVSGGRAALGAQTRAVYRLMDRFRERFPGLRIESCSSGGARIDLEVLRHTDRVWASDTNDPTERLAIQRWTELLLPPEVIGSHVGPERAHTTGRQSDIGYRLASTLFSWAGIEADVSRWNDIERQRARDWFAFYRANRPLLHAGVLLHGETDDDGTQLTGVVDRSRSRGIYRYARTETSVRSVPPRIALPGLEAATRYRVTIVDALPDPLLIDLDPPPWLKRGHVVGTGFALGRVGLAAPLLAPQQALVLEVDAITEGT